MATYSFNGNASYDGTNQQDTFFMQSATRGVIINAFSGNDYIISGSYNDFIYGYDDDDTIYGGNGKDFISGMNGNDLLYGGVFDGNGGRFTDNSSDIIYGGDGNDLIFYDFSGDGFYGGAGDDTYIYNAQSSGFTTDTIIEVAGEGTDTIYVGQGNYPMFSTVADEFDTPDYIENVIVIGQVDYIFGNDIDNTMIGSQFSEYIDGEGGNDLINGAAGDDIIIGDNGNDFLYGGDGFDDLYGDSGNDLLIGDAGIDVMFGGPGNDLYGVDILFDVVVENVGEGYDEIYANSDYGLPDNVETLFLTGTAVYGSGNGGNNALIGNAASNILDAGAGTFESLVGGGGNDLLIGGAGHDQLLGGTGADTFRFQNPTSDVFNGASNDGDFIFDFTAGQGDKVQLNASAFGLSFGVVEGVNFFSGTSPAATQATPTLLYNTQSNLLFYDGDGSGAGGLTILGGFGGGPNLHATDFVLY